MKIRETTLPEVLLFEPDVFGDSRGFFYETFNRRRYAEHGLPADFVQDNLSYSTQGILRGLHFQHPQAQGKLIMVLRGAVLDVAVDIRVGSSSFGQWTSIELSAENRRQLWVPPGFAHGFCVTSEDALFLYKCSEYYDPSLEGTIAWDDPDLAIAWPSMEMQLSPKDRQGRRLADIPAQRLPVFSK